MIIRFKISAHSFNRLITKYHIVEIKMDGDKTDRISLLVNKHISMDFEEAKNQMFRLN